VFVDLIVKLLATKPQSLHTTTAGVTEDSDTPTTESPAMPHDCSEILNSGERSDGVYTAYIGRAQSPVQVYCDQSTDGGGWTVCIIPFKCAKTVAMLSHVTGTVSHQHWLMNINGYKYSQLFEHSYIGRALFLHTKTGFGPRTAILY